MAPPRLHIICEKDFGLFGLLRRTLSHIPWAIQEGRIPIACFQKNTCYWTPSGYQGGDTVWEYYFEPLVPDFPASRIPSHIRAAIALNPPRGSSLGYFLNEHTFVTSHSGDHPELKGKTLPVIYDIEDPEDALRQAASAIMQAFVRPRQYIQEKVNQFFRAQMAGSYLIGAHVRGTDAISEQDPSFYRRGSLSLPKYVHEIERLLKQHPDARIFVATDAQSSLDYLKEHFGSRIIAYDSLRHEGGEAAGKGPTGRIMPAYIAGDRDRAARNGEEAVIECLLLSRCQCLVHNGSNLARTVLLKDPKMPHTNTHTGPRYRLLHEFIEIMKTKAE